MNANIEYAGIFHEVAKDLDKKTIPPLAKLHLEGQSCNGLSDMFYIAAFTIKKLVDKQYKASDVLNAHLTMLTLLSDSGFQLEAERHLEEALKLEEADFSSLKMRSILMTPGVFESMNQLYDVRGRLEGRLQNISEDSTFSLKNLDEFSLSPIFYFIYQGFNDAPFMQKLQNLYASAHPNLATYKIDRRPTALLGTPADRRSLDTNDGDIARIRVGFVSSHFRRHSICKLFCNVITGLSNHTHITSNGEKLGFEVYVFSGQDQSREDGFTTHLKHHVKEFVRIKKFTTTSRREVTSRFIDVLVYLDIGMDPSTSVWGASKLAPIQACLWGHPTTTGMGSMDYFISADEYHLDSQKNQLSSSNEVESYANTYWYRETEHSFTEQLVRLPSAALGFSFSKPSFDMNNETFDFISKSEPMLQYISSLLPNSSLPNSTDTLYSLESLVQLKLQNDSKFILIPQHLPKFHPVMDSLLYDILNTIPNSYILITYELKRTIWRRTLEKRWLGNNFTVDMIQNRILWLSHLTPQQYLGLLSLGDIMLDPYPFGGGVTSLEAFSVCTPVLTLPKKQTVPALTAGMLRTIFSNHSNPNIIKEFIFDDDKSLLQQIQLLLNEPEKMMNLRKLICENNQILYSESVVSIQTIYEWGNFLYSIFKNNFF